MIDSLSHPKTIARRIGVLVWATAATAAAITLLPNRDPGDGRSGDGVSVLRGWFAATDTIRLRDPGGELRTNDPVFRQTRDGWKQIGYVAATDRGAAADGSQVTLRLRDDSLRGQRWRWTAHTNHGNLAEVVSTLLPEDKRRRVMDRLNELLTLHGREMSAAMMPLVRESLIDSLPLIQDGIRRSISRHEDRWDQLTIRWKDEVIEQRLLPLAKTELLPIVLQYGEPVAQSIGRDLWDRASLWRFGWRAFYDKAPLPKRDLTQQEWSRFVAEEAIPVFESHMDEIVVAVQQTIMATAANPQIRQELLAVVEQLAADPQTQELVQLTVREAILDNAPLREHWQATWSSDRARAAIRIASGRIEPTLRQIGDELLGSREGGISPEFARVLRTQILGKDKRWVTVIPATQSGPDRDGDPGVIHRATTPMPFPVILLAEPTYPLPDSNERFRAERPSVLSH